jgi:hypothetical protein
MFLKRCLSGRVIFRGSQVAVETSLRNETLHAELEPPMDASRCPHCKKRLMAMTDRTGRTRLVCLKCDNVDPMKTDAAKWANSSLATGR